MGHNTYMVRLIWSHRILCVKSWSESRGTGSIEKAFNHTRTELSILFKYIHKFWWLVSVEEIWPLAEFEWNGKTENLNSQYFMCAIPGFSWDWNKYK